MKNRFANWTQEHPCKAVIVLTLGLAAIILTVLAASRVYATFAFRGYGYALDNVTNEVSVYRVYKDGHQKLVGTFSESTGDGTNWLLDPMYAGNAPLATSYDPRGMYEDRVDVLFFEFNRGAKYGDYGSAEFDRDAGILKISLGDEIASWVDQDGVIACATVRDGEPIVAIYRDRDTASEPLL